MARIRSIKPAFFRHQELFELEQQTGFPCRVAFAGLWTAADREGRFRWRPAELKLDCLPFDAVDFGAVLDALSRGGFVRRYEVEGRVYGWIPSWNDHQSINQRESASTLPEPDECAHMRARGEGKGREGEKEGKGTEGSAVSHATPAPAAADGLIVLVFPTEGTPADWRLRRSQVDEWQGVYPSLDILDECQRALTWVKANPGHRKTARGMCAFLVNWFNRSVNRRGGVSAGPAMGGGVGTRTAALARASADFLAGGKS